MALNFTAPSDGFRSLILQKPELSRSIENISESAPHKVYTISPEDMESASGLGAARQIGWRIFHLNEPETVVEGYCDENDNQHEFGGYNQGPFVEGTREVLKLAGALDQTSRDDFEVAMIKLPWIYVMALWLKHQDAGQDIIIPFGPSNNALTSDRVYSQAEFMEALRTAQNARPDFDDEGGRN